MIPNIICENLSKKYGKKEVLSNINLTLEPNKIYGLIGRNGAGKTTLLSILSAHNPATGGTVTLGEDKIWENQKALEDICFSRELNISPSSTIGGMKVKDYLKTASMHFRNWDKEYADYLVKEFELDVKKRLNKLSKGMLSMVTIVVALASKAEYTFLDEPVAGLDIIMREFFYKLLLDEYGKTGRTFVVSTHIIEEAAGVFEEVIILKEGEILLKEDTQELIERAVLVSGMAEEVDAATEGLEKHHEEATGRAKSVVVLLKKGESFPARGKEVQIKTLNLQNVFTALCGKEVGK